MKSQTRHSATMIGATAVIAMMAGGCDNLLPLTWKSTAPPAVDTPAGFARLWSTNCAGCHGADGSHGPARAMNDPVYLASMSDADLVRIISKGSPPGTLMPGFSLAAGGALADTEINAIVSGMRTAWGRADAKPSSIAFAAPTQAGDPTRGKAAFERACIACHHADAIADGVNAGSVTDPFFLQLVSDQSLRSTIIFGRVDLGMPGAGGPFPDRPVGEGLTAQEVNDIVTWLSQRRTEDWPPKSIRRGGKP